jgi:serine phosphatase RsbU (regulator of sigma subunit)
LRLRLTVTVVLTVLTVTCIGVSVDYRREYRVLIEQVLVSLNEQAHALAIARRQISDPQRFARYANEICARMDGHTWPGHDILVLDSQGHVLVCARHDSGSVIEETLVSADPHQSILSIEGHRLARVSVKDEDGTTIIFAQYLDVMESVLRRQLLSRAVTMALTAVGIMVLIFLAIQLWAIRPITRLAEVARAWSARDFSARADPMGAAELRILCDEFNTMAGELNKHEQHRIAELEGAKSVQANFLPAKVPDVPGLKIAAEYRPAAHVAGDLYDIFELPGGATAVTIIDVAGHGISAALLTGLVRMSLRYCLSAQPNPAKALESVNRDVMAAGTVGQFVSASVGVWDKTERTWTYSVAGHPPAVLVAGGVPRPLELSGSLLGVVPDGKWDTLALHLNSGDRLFLYTDGVIEAGSRGYMLEVSGLEQLLKASVGLGLAEQIAMLLEHVIKRSPGGTPVDDMTVVGLEVLPDGRS